MTKLLGLFTIYKQKPVGTRFVQMVSNGKARFPFGNSVEEFWTTFQEIPFSPEIFRLGRPKQAYHLHSNRNFRIFVVNAKQSRCKSFCALMPLLLVKVAQTSFNASKWKRRIRRINQGLEGSAPKRCIMY